MAEAGGLGREPRQLAVGMIAEHRHHEQERRPVGRARIALGEQNRGPKPERQAQRRQVIGMDRRGGERPDHDGGEPLIPGLVGHGASPIEGRVVNPPIPRPAWNIPA